jgi:hypothetical protein
MCEAGKHGKFCKHQAGILKCFSLVPPNAPGVTAEKRHRIAVLELHDEAEPVSFYQPLIWFFHHKPFTRIFPSGFHRGG